MSSTEKDERLAQRHAMVEEQLRRRGIEDLRVLGAMLAVPRHRFVPEALASAAYEDRALPIGHGQTISQPYMVARACELAELEEASSVLEVGGGSGYQAAVLTQLCEHVVTVELVPELAERARTTLEELGIENVLVLRGDGTRGHTAGAPYDAILVAAGTPNVPEALMEQLVIGGRLVIPIGSIELQSLTVLRKTDDGYERRTYDPCVYVPLR